MCGPSLAIAQRPPVGRKPGPRRMGDLGIPHRGRYCCRRKRHCGCVWGTDFPGTKMRDAGFRSPHNPCRRAATFLRGLRSSTPAGVRRVWHPSACRPIATPVQAVTRNGTRGRASDAMLESGISQGASHDCSAPAGYRKKGCPMKFSQKHKTRLFEGNRSRTEIPATCSRLDPCGPKWLLMWQSFCGHRQREYPGSPVL